MPDTGVSGLLVALAPVPFILAWLDIHAGLPPLWRLTAAGIAAATGLACAFLLFRNTKIGKFLGFLALGGAFIAAYPHLTLNPFAALIGSAGIITGAYVLFDFRIQFARKKQRRVVDNCRRRARWAAAGTLLPVALSFFSGKSPVIVTHTVIMASTLTALGFLLNWSLRHRSRFIKTIWSCLSLLLALFLIAAFRTDYFNLLCGFAGIFIYLMLPGKRQIQEQREHWWQMLLDQPARIMFSTFVALCFIGALLLSIPAATSVNGIAPVDAAFTSVSAVCVTGLIVLDTPKDFTVLGQAFILVLIQLGGLGIMSIATVALHAMGRRISLHQERVLSSITGAERHDLLTSLVTILKFTFIVESIGAISLTGAFAATGDMFQEAAWRGVFTAISAFCNAGFALQSNSLVPYQHHPFILQIIATLIICGGIAPATVLLFPAWVSGRRIPEASRIQFIATAILLVAGALFIAAMEWNRALSGLGFIDKLNNAWFQSATLRTAGFNSIDIVNVLSPTYLVMLCFMFIGGSPGGTAGGIKTTTVSVLALTFWANINRRNDVLTRNRRIRSTTIYRAVTIVAAGACIWFITVLMLEITQQINARDLIFEATSAIGTVGLSTGATQHLDEIGKVIVMLAMFVGRIGPMTIFMLLNSDAADKASGRIEAKINLS